MNAFEALYVAKRKTLLLEIVKDLTGYSSWLGLTYPKELKEFDKLVDNKYFHFITLDLTGVFENCAEKSISLFCTNPKTKLPSWDYIIHKSVKFDNEGLAKLRFDKLVKDNNSIGWMTKMGYGVSKSKIGGKPSFIQEKIETKQPFFFQVNWEDIVFDANEIIGKKFDIVSEAFMGGNLYLFAAINMKKREINFDKITIYHQYS